MSSAPKRATAEAVSLLDANLAHLAAIIKRDVNIDVKDEPVQELQVV